MSAGVEIPMNPACAATDGRQGWLDGLPDVIEDVTRRWSLSVGAPFQPGGSTAWVAPARNRGGTEVVLKVVMRHPEADHEGAGLRLWDGYGAIRLFDEAEYEESIALLLERCVPGSMLRELPEPDQDQVVCGLLRRLWRPPPPRHPFRTLAQMCTQWADQFEEKAQTHEPDLDPGLVREGMALFRSLPATAEREVVLLTDLHAHNVLAAQREPWLVIDPKPHVGDPTYDALQHMLNCEERLQADPRRLVVSMASSLDLDPGRLTHWLFARCVQESLECPGLAPVALELAPH